MTDSISLHNADILVTGASGFIGGRLVDYLVLHFHANVRALVRNVGRAAHLARLPVKLIFGDLMDPISVQRAMEGCDIVFHCAAGMAGDDVVRYQSTFNGTINVVEAAIKADIKRLVHISTIAVHDPDSGLVISENTPLSKSNDIYTKSKVEAEKIIFRYRNEKNLPVVVLRPTIVYGPRSGSWVMGPINSMKKGMFSLIEDGSGIANHVYVDDVVQAMLLAAIREEAVGEEFIISYGSGVTWKEFFNYYAQWLNLELPNISTKDIESIKWELGQLRSPVNMGLSFIASPHAQSVIRQIPIIGSTILSATNIFPKNIRQTILERSKMLREIRLNPPVLPKQSQIDLFSAKATCQIDKAQEFLGYQPQISLEEGMRLTEAWLRYKRII